MHEGIRSFYVVFFYIKEIYGAIQDRKTSPNTNDLYLAIHFYNVARLAEFYI